MCEPRAGEANQLFSVYIALWHSTALAIIYNVVGRHRNLGLWRPVTYRAALFLFCLFDFYGIEPKLWWHIYGSQTKFVRHIVFALVFFIILIIYSSSSFFLPSKVCQTHFSEMPWSNFMKPCRNIICHVKLFFKVLIFSKWLPLPWNDQNAKKMKKIKKWS